MTESGSKSRLPARTLFGLRLASLRRRTISRTLHPIPYGAGTVYLSDADFAVDRASFAFAIAEGSYVTDYRNAVVLDVGAHKGYYAAYAVAHGAHAVVTYEPESANLAVLKRTAAGYRAHGVTWHVRQAAVDARQGRAALHVMGASWGHALEPPDAFARHEIGMETVDVVALELALGDVTQLHSGGRVIVKINIEGAECSAILGTAADAWRDVDELFVETHPWATCDADDLAAYLASAGLSQVTSAHPAVLRMRREGRSQSD